MATDFAYAAFLFPVLICIGVLIAFAVIGSPTRNGDQGFLGLERITFAGPPNYESIEAGDAAEPYFVLRLSRPVCVQLANQARVSASMLQLFLQPAQYDRYRRSLGSRIDVSGRLWPAETGHHHTPLMSTPVEQQDDGQAQLRD